MAKAVTDAGLNHLRDLLRDDVSLLSVGSGASAPTNQDTALESVLQVLSSTGQAGGVGVVTHRARVGVSDLNGETLREAGDVASDGRLLNRVTFNPLEKTTAFEVEVRMTKSITRGVS